MSTPLIFSVSCYVIQDFVVRAITIIFEKKRSRITNMEQIGGWEGGGNVLV